MNHEAAREQLLDRAYGELDRLRAQALEEHLAGCAACRAEAERLARTLGVMRRLEPVAEPPGEAILLAAARQATQARAPRPLFPWLRLSLGVALVLVAGGVSLKLLLGTREGAPKAARRMPEVVAVAPEPSEPKAVAVVEDAPAAAGELPARAKAGPRPSPAAARRQEAAGAGAARADQAPPARAVEAATPPEAASVPPSPPGSEARSAAPAGQAAVRAPPADVLQPRVAGTREAVGPSPLDDAEEMVRGLRRRRDAGQLNEAKRRPDPCPGGDTLRLAWFDGWGKARRYARTGPLPGGGEATRDHYYDEQGRLRLVHVVGTGPEGHFARRIVFDEAGSRLLEDPLGIGAWPAADLTLRDGGAAFWAPQRCTAPDP